MNNFSGMMFAARTMLAIAILSMASIAVAEGDLNQRIFQAAMGHLGDHFTSNCPKLQPDMGSPAYSKSEQCEKDAIAKLIKYDEKNAVNSVVTILLDNGVIFNSSNENYNECYQKDGLWSHDLIADIASYYILPEPSVTPENIKSQVDDLNRLCDPPRVKAFMGVLGALITILEPVREARKKEVGRITDESLAKIHAEEEQQRKIAEKEQQERQALQRERAKQKSHQEEANSRRKALIREQAQIEEAEKMKDPAYRAAKEAAKEREQKQQRADEERQQKQQKCRERADQQVQECLDRASRSADPGPYAKGCAAAHRDIVYICAGIDPRTNIPFNQ